MSTEPKAVTIPNLLQECLRLRALNAQLLAALTTCQWGGSASAGQRTCPQCHEGERDGHSPACQVSAAIAKAEETK